MGITESIFTLLFVVGILCLLVVIVGPFVDKITTGKWNW